MVQYWNSDTNYVQFEDGANYGDRWIEAMVPLPNNVTDDPEYNVQIKAYRGPSAYGNDNRTIKEAN